MCALAGIWLVVSHGVVHQGELEQGWVLDCGHVVETLNKVS
jgi:hypothetical protein